MDVNSIGQNINLYNTNSNASQYGLDNSDTAIPQVQKAEAVNVDGKNEKNEEYSKKDLDKALKKINGFLKDEHTRAEYSVHKDFGTIMIKIIDEDTKETILEIPPKKILDMVADMCRQVGLFDKRA